MCYEFAHHCDHAMIDQIGRMLGAGGYFMVCIGELNYLYAAGQATIDTVKGYLLLREITLHQISEPEMLRILRFPDTIVLQTMHGSKELFDRFISPVAGQA
jgi:hypothetical protein